jgi:hypothetical protein
MFPTEASPAPKPVQGSATGSPGNTPEGDDTLGFEVATASRKPKTRKSAAPKVRRVRASAEPRVEKKLRWGGWPRKLPVARLGAGMGLAWRRFLLDATSAAMNFESGVFSQVAVVGEVYPLPLVTSSRYALLGVRLEYAHSAGLDADPDPDGDSGERLATTINRFWGGLTYMVPRFRNQRLPRLDLRVGLAHMGFGVPDNPTVQDVSFTTFAAGATMVVLFKPYLGMELGGEYRMMLRARSDFINPYQASPGGLQGFNVVGGLQGKVLAGLGYRVSITGERLVGDLPALDSDASLKVRDWYVCAAMALTYEM